MTTRYPELDVKTRTKMQYLLDTGEQRFFATHPSETERRRFYFRGERIDIDGEPGRYVVVSRDDDGRLVRRFATARGDV